jgi:hypothetical protein
MEPIYWNSAPDRSDLGNSIIVLYENGQFRPVTPNDFGGSWHDFSGQLLPASGSEYVIDNSGYSTIGLHIHTPSGTNVGFYGSFNGSDYDNITLRQLGDDGYTQTAENNDSCQDFIGSVSALRKIKFIVDRSGSATGCVAGRLIKQVSTLEGIEHNAPPHKFGNTPFHKGIYLNNTTGSGMLIYQPPTGYKFVITDLQLSVSSDGGLITFYEDGNANDRDSWVFAAYVKATLGNTEVHSRNFSTPYVANTINNGLYYTVTADSTIRGVIHGYYTK